MIDQNWDLINTSVPGSHLIATFVLMAQNLQAPQPGPMSMLTDGCFRHVGSLNVYDHLLVSGVGVCV